MNSLDTHIIKNYNDQLLEMHKKYNVPLDFKVSKELQEMIKKIEFPFTAVFYRKKVSLRNSNYLNLSVIRSLGDYGSLKRTFKHHGWPITAMTFKVCNQLLEFGKHNNRTMYIKLQNWDEVIKYIVKEEKCLIPIMKQLYPCPETQVKTKKGQYKLIM